MDNVLDLLSEHQKQKIFYSKNISEETDFLSSHFYELNEEQMKEFFKKWRYSRKNNFKQKTRTWVRRSTLALFKWTVLTKFWIFKIVWIRLFQKCKQSGNDWLSIYVQYRVLDAEYLALIVDKNGWKKWKRNWI